MAIHSAANEKKLRYGRPGLLFWEVWVVPLLFGCCVIAVVLNEVEDYRRARLAVRVGEALTQWMAGLESDDCRNV